MLSQRQRECCAEILSLGADQGVALYVVGGLVRDLLSGHAFQASDIDILVDGDALVFARQVQSALGGTLKLFPEFLTAKLVALDRYPELPEVDFASSRTEIYKLPGALPEVAPAGIADDLRRRDFSINAMALPFDSIVKSDYDSLCPESLKKKCLDLFQGVSDLEQRHIRVLHGASFCDDPTRLFRALRYQRRISGQLEPGTADLFAQATAQGVVAHISLRRQVNELVKMLSEVDSLSVLRSSISSGLLATCFSSVASSAGSGIIADCLEAIASLPHTLRVSFKGALEGAILISLMAHGAKLADLYQQLSISRSLRATLEQDLDMAEEVDRSHVFSAAGLLYFAARHSEHRAWALSQLEARGTTETGVI